MRDSTINGLKKKGDSGNNCFVAPQSSCWVYVDYIYRLLSDGAKIKKTKPAGSLPAEILQNRADLRLNSYFGERFCGFLGWCNRNSHQTSGFLESPAYQKSLPQAACTSDGELPGKKQGKQAQPSYNCAFIRGACEVPVPRICAQWDPASSKHRYKQQEWETPKWECLLMFATTCSIIRMTRTGGDSIRNHFQTRAKCQAKSVPKHSTF